MAENSAIEWTDHTFNPWWGCVRVSPGCVHCYAETFDRRVSGVEGAHWGVKAGRRFFGDSHWQKPRNWNAKAETEGARRRVFCASMADVFEDREELVEHRARLFCLIQETPALDWLLLTKRPENVMAMVPENWQERFPENVWMGTTCEDQQRADERVPVLLSIPAAVRFLSCEPLIGPVDLSLFLPPMAGAGWVSPHRPASYDGRPLLHWVIIGGESGHGARPLNVEWARDLVIQCRAAGVVPFVKQLGARPIREKSSSYRHDLPGGSIRVAEFEIETTYQLADAKGGDWSEWPEDLRVREFPEVAHV